MARQEARPPNFFYQERKVSNSKDTLTPRPNVPKLEASRLMNPIDIYTQRAIQNHQAAEKGCVCQGRCFRQQFHHSISGCEAFNHYFI